MIDRLSIRERPRGWPVMHQMWGKLLFLHWKVPAERLRPLIHPRLAIDTWRNTAWVGITPFTMWGIRPPFFPALPVLSQSHELNVRTYVHLDGVPGVWFLSLDASNSLAVLGARLLFGLPYYDARMRLEEKGETIRFSSRRTHSGARPGEFDVVWTRGEPLQEAKPESLDFFLIERYCLYSMKGGRLHRCRIHHHPWPLRRAKLASLRSTMMEADGLDSPIGEPLIHAQGDPLEVEIWPLEGV